MHMTYFLILSSVIVFADVFTGGLLREYIFNKKNEYAVDNIFALSLVAAYASDAPPGFRFVRSYSRHKL